MRNPKTYRMLLLAASGAVLAIAFLLSLSGPARAAVLLSEGFDGGVAGEEAGGRFVSTHGPGNQGWQAEVDQSKARKADYVQYAVADGAQYSSVQGTIELWVRNDRRGGLTTRKDGVEYNTLFHLMGDGFTLTAYILDESPKADGVSALVLWGNRYTGDGPLRMNPFGKDIPLGRKIRQGEWAHLAFTWGPAPADNAIYLDGKPLDLAIAPEQRTNFGRWLAGAHTLRIGADTYNTSHYKDGTNLLYNWVIDDFKIHDEVVTSFDLSRLTPVIRSVTHDALAVAGYSGKLVTGQTVTVTLRSEPGGVASFDLGRTIAGIAMAEDRKAPGTYVGTYSVRPGDLVEDGAVTGRFVGGLGLAAAPVAAPRPIEIDGTTHLAVSPSNDLIPADRASRAGLTVVATDANGKAVRDHQLRVTLSTTDEYTGTVGAGTFDDAVGGSLEVDWKGVTDSFGEVTAQYVSGFAAKTVLLSAKDMVSGDVGVGWVRSYIDGQVDIVVKRPEASALSFAGTMEVTASRTWLTADGKSRSRITAVVKDESGAPMAGHNVQFTMAGDNGALKAVQSRTDGKGRAYADYVAGKVMGQVTIEVVDTTSGLSGSIVIELRPDAPAEITLVADPGEVVIGGSGATVTATVKDVNGNPNRDVDVVYDITMGEGTLASSTVATNEKGVAAVRYTPGGTPGVVTVRGTVTSRVPTDVEISAAEGAVFLYGLPMDPGVLVVSSWLASPGDEVFEGQDLVVMADRDGTSYTIKAPRDGKVSVFTAEEGDEVNYGDTLAYILPVEEKK